MRARQHTVATFLIVIATGVLSAQIAILAQTSAPSPPRSPSPSTPPQAPPSPSPPTPPSQGQQVLHTKFSDLQWKRDSPDLGERSPSSVLLRLDAQTQASEWMVRLPPGFRLPMHWHSANQTHTVISGTYVMREHDGNPIDLPAGSFNYTPARLVHEGWVKGDEPVALFVTFDGKRDNHIAEVTPPPNGEIDGTFLCITPDQVQWQRFDSNDAARLAILHEHPRTGASFRLMHCPPRYRIPMHTHSCSEARIVLAGSITIDCIGSAMKLDRGSYSFIPAQHPHSARVGSKPTTLLISTDQRWDFAVDQPPLKKK